MDPTLPPSSRRRPSLPVHLRASRRWRPAVLGALAALAVLPAVGGVGTHRAATAVGELPPDPVLFAAGDIARCVEPNGADDTAAIIDQVPGAYVAMLGDGAYPSGTIEDYTNCYAPSWGRFYDRTLPVGGNHDYMDKVNAPGYFQYFANRLDDPGFSPTATDTKKGYYSYDIGPWHVITLNATFGGADGGNTLAQQEWLKADLAATQSKCMIAMWHHARFFSSADGDGTTPFPSADKKMSKLWEILRGAGVDVALQGHHHIYERFAPMASDTGTDQGRMTGPGEHGIRSFVVGTGGGEYQPFSTEPGKTDPPLGSEYRKDMQWGVLRLDLHSTTYDWKFVTPAGQVLDSGTDTCRTDLSATSTTASTAPTPGPTTGATAPGPVAPPTTAGGSADSIGGPRSGYWMLGEDGTVYPFGDSKALGDTSLRAGTAVDLEPTPSGGGYWIVNEAGTVSNFGDARHLGDAPREMAPGESVSSLSATPSGGGYWLFTDRGRVMALGDAKHFGDVSALKLNGPVLDSIATPSGLGYYMVASDGGIFAFGDATFAGSMGGTSLNAPVQSLVPDSDGGGYWLVASDGGIFAFDAPFRGSMGATPLNKPVVGMVRFGTGYLMVGADGGIFSFSDRKFLGSLGDKPPARPVTAVAVLGG